MLTFIRNLRRLLINPLAAGKDSETPVHSTSALSPASRYFLYAIGEIALVVIGILIALQINTWNTNSTNRQLEQDYISRLENEIKTEVVYLGKTQSSLQDKRDRLTRLVKIWNSDNYIIVDSLEFINDVKASGSLGPWYNEPITWTQLIQTGDLKLIKDQELIDKLYSYYNLMKKQAKNYEQHPMNMTNEARKIIPTLLLDEKMESLFRGEEESNRNIPNAIIYDRIRERKDELKDLFLTIAFISTVSQSGMGQLVVLGNDIIAHIESKKI